MNAAHASHNARAGATLRLLGASDATDWPSLLVELRDLFAEAAHRHPDARPTRLDIVLAPQRLSPPPASSAEAAGWCELLAWLAAHEAHGLAYAVHQPRQRRLRAHRLLLCLRLPARPEKNSPKIWPLPASANVSTCSGELRRPTLVQPTGELSMNASFRPYPQHPPGKHSAGQRKPARTTGVADALRRFWEKIERPLFGPAADWQEETDLVDEPPPGPRHAAELRQSWLQAFNNALTEATALLLRDYVEPVHADDPSTGFSVRSIEVALPEVHAPGLRTIADMPSEARQRITIARCQKAPGAAEQLEFDKFRGLNVVAPETLVDGYLVHTLLAGDGARLHATFRFSGDYVTLRRRASANGEAPAAARPRLPEGTDGAPGTPLRSPACTPLRVAQRATEPPLLYLRLLGDGDERRHPVHAGQFPLTIGCAPSGEHTYTVHAGRLDADGKSSFVSGDHLQIIAYDSSTRLVSLRNLGRNGSYLGRAVQPERFTLCAGSGEIVSLGGSDGEGTAQLRIETP